MSNPSGDGAKKYRLLVVDDHPILRFGLSQLLNQEPDLLICAEAENAEQALAAIEAFQPDLAIVDIMLPGSSGIELTKRVKQLYPELPILILSMHDESMYAERALRAGALGYIMKYEATTNLVTAIRKVLGGEIFLSPRMASQMLDLLVDRRASAAGGGSPVQLLSDRELEIFQLIGSGMGTRQIAEKLGLSIKTIETHRTRIRYKLKINSATELVRQAVLFRRNESLD